MKTSPQSQDNRYFGPKPPHRRLRAGTPAADGDGGRSSIPICEKKKEGQ